MNLKSNKRINSKIAVVLVLVTIISSFMSVGVFAEENDIDSVQLGEVTGNGVNMREEADTDSKVLTVIPEGTKIAVVEKTSSWYKVMIAGYIGYMSSSYIDILEDDDVSLSYGKIIGEYVNMRAGAGTYYPVVATMTAESYVKIIGINDGWFHVVTLGGKYEGYMSPNYIIPVKKSEVEGEVTEKSTSSSSKSSSSSSKSSSSGSSSSSSGSSKAENLIEIAKSYIGVPYVWGGNSPSGFDCGGFTKYCFKKIGISIPRTSQINAGSKVSYGDLRTGDLVFFSSGNETYGHVGIYISGGRFIHAPSPGNNVEIETLASGYYYTHFTGARRVIG